MGYEREQKRKFRTCLTCGKPRNYFVRNAGKHSLFVRAAGKVRRLFFYDTYYVFSFVFVGDKLGYGGNQTLFERLFRAMRFGVDYPYRVHFVSEKFDTDRLFFGGRPHVENIAAKRESSVVGKLRFSFVTCRDEFCRNGGGIERVAAFYAEYERGKPLGVGAQAEQRFDGRNDEFRSAARDKSERAESVRSRASARGVAVRERVRRCG